jgi:hypothetical protein
LHGDPQIFSHVAQRCDLLFFKDISASRRTWTRMPCRSWLPALPLRRVVAATQVAQRTCGFRKLCLPTELFPSFSIHCCREWSTVFRGEVRLPRFHRQFRMHVFLWNSRRSDFGPLGNVAFNDRDRISKRFLRFSKCVEEFCFIESSEISKTIATRNNLRKTFGSSLSVSHTSIFKSSVERTEQK